MGDRFTAVVLENDRHGTVIRIADPPVRARMHRGRTRLGLIVVAHAPVGVAAVSVGAGAAAVSFPAGKNLALKNTAKDA